MNKSETRYEKWQNFKVRNRQSEGYLLRKKVFDKLYRLTRAILLFGMCFLILQPLANKISISFMAEKDLYDATVISIPRNFTTENYKLVNELIGFWKALFNTIWIAL